jgi:hypothetical protein
MVSSVVALCRVMFGQQRFGRQSTLHLLRWSVRWHRLYYYGWLSVDPWCQGIELCVVAKVRVTLQLTVSQSVTASSSLGKSLRFCTSLNVPADARMCLSCNGSQSLSRMWFFYFYYYFNSNSLYFLNKIYTHNYIRGYSFRAMGNRLCSMAV